MRSGESHHRSRRGLHYATLTLGAGLFALPLMWMISVSLRPTGELNAFPPPLIPTDFAWENYPEAISRFPFWRALFNSALITVIATGGTVLSCSMVAFGFARCRFPGRQVLFGILLATMMLPPIVLLVPSFVLFTKLGWINTFYPLTVPAFLATNAFSVFLLRQFYLTIPREYDDSAYVDGASRLRVWWSIILPLSRPALTVVAVLTIVVHWNDFLGPLIYLRDEDKRTLAIGLQYFQEQEQVQWNLLMAAATLMTIPMVLLFLFAQRYFIRGFSTAGFGGK